MSIKKALFIGAHSDENECCTGGLAYLLNKNDFEIIFLNVSCKMRFEADAQSRERYAEQDIRAAEVLGAKKIIIGERDDGFFFCTSQSIKDIMEQVRDVEPDIAFIHWPQDNHVDHLEVSRAALKALCYSSDCEIHAFEAGPFQSMAYFYPDFFINITNCMQKIYESLSVFDQPSADGNWLCKEKEVIARFRGHSCGFAYAEAYKMIRFPGGNKSPELMLPKLLGTDFRWCGNRQYPWGCRYFQP